MRFTEPCEEVGHGFRWHSAKPADGHGLQLSGGDEVKARGPADGESAGCLFDGQKNERWICGVGRGDMNVVHEHAP